MEEERKWMEKAEEDLKIARFNSEGNMLNAAGFYAQQAAEKALKAVYIRKHKKLWKTHDLSILASEVKAPQSLKKKCAELSRAYTITRYPDVEETYSKGDIKIFLETAKMVIEWSRKELSRK